VDGQLGFELCDSSAGGDELALSLLVSPGSWLVSMKSWRCQV
jgi:hypothetical protein